MSLRSLLAAALLLAVPTGSFAAHIQMPERDGWYSWAVTAGSAGRSSCCYHWRSGAAWIQGCALDGHDDGGDGGFNVGGCDLDSDELRVYVRVRGGNVDDVRAFSADCPVTARGEIRDLGQVDIETSIDWLRAYLDGNQDDSSEVLAAIAKHAGDAAADALIDIIEDRDSSRDYREEALFWLVQSGSDSAFRYLDRILNASRET